MARRKKTRATISEHPAHDGEALIARLQDEAGEVLAAEVDFDALLTKVLTADPDRVGVALKRRKSKSKANRTKK